MCTFEDIDLAVNIIKNNSSHHFFIQNDQQNKDSNLS